MTLPGGAVVSLVTVGSRLRLLRTAFDLTQKSLAKRSGVQQNTIARLEAGAQVSAHPATFQKLATVLQVPVESFENDTACVAAVASLCGVQTSALEVRDSNPPPELPVMAELRKLVLELGPERTLDLIGAVRALARVTK